MHYAALFTAAILTSTFVNATPANITSKTPYQPRQDYKTYSKVSKGYQLAMIQHVARHGSRGLSSPDDDLLLMQLLQQAKKEHALKPLGKKLINEVTELTHVQNEIGYGEISTLGKQEHANMAERMVKRHTDFFQQQDNRRPIFISHSGRSRAAKSGDAFISELVNVAPNIASHLKTPYASKSTLYFHKAEGAADYKEYKDNDPRILRALDQLESSEQSNVVVASILNRLFTTSFITKLTQGEYSFSANNGEDTLKTPLDVVHALYSIYCVTPDLVLDSNTLDMNSFISDQEASWLAYIDDADSFYGRGPGFTGNDITYRAADSLFTEMLKQIDMLNTTPNEAPLASYRFTHAQVLMPIATWLQLAGTEITVNEGEQYTYDNNPWRGSEISPMAANVQWEVYNSRNNPLLVRMLHNEQEVTFPDNCQPIDKNGYFYTFTEIKHCLTELHQLKI